MVRFVELKLPPAEINLMKVGNKNNTKPNIVLNTFKLKKKERVMTPIGLVLMRMQLNLTTFNTTNMTFTWKVGKRHMIEL